MLQQSYRAKGGWSAGPAVPPQVYHTLHPESNSLHVLLSNTVSLPEWQSLGVSYQLGLGPPGIGAQPVVNANQALKHCYLYRP